eukprot:scaffold324010_cov52-Tisochrysis_lutea.AAC.2
MKGNQLASGKQDPLRVDAQVVHRTVTKLDAFRPSPSEMRGSARRPNRAWPPRGSRKRTYGSPMAAM